jgi:hypothetical protein
LKDLVYDGPVDIHEAVKQRVAETNHSYPLLAQLGGNQPLFQENPGDVAVPVHDSQTFVGNDMISHVQQGFNRKVQETFSTAVPLSEDPQSCQNSS